MHPERRSKTDVKVPYVKNLKITGPGRPKLCWFETQEFRKYTKRGRRKNKNSNRARSNIFRRKGRLPDVPCIENPFECQHSTNCFNESKIQECKKVLKSIYANATEDYIDKHIVDLIKEANGWVKGDEDCKHDPIQRFMPQKRIRNACID